MVEIVEEKLLGSNDEDSEDVLEFLPVHFILCRLPLILLGQAEQCLLGVQLPEKSFWR